MADVCSNARMASTMNDSCVDDSLAVVGLEKGMVSTLSRTRQKVEVTYQLLTALVCAVDRFPTSSLRACMLHCCCVSAASPIGR